MTTAPVVTITDEIVADLEGLVELATPGPWHYAQHDDCQYVAGPCDEFVCTDGDHVHDIEFIVAANPAIIRALLQERASLLAHITRLQNGVADDYAEVERMHGEYMVQWRNARKLRAELRELRDSMTFRTSLIGRLEEDRDKWKALAESKAAQ